ncbi:MAG: hypothetical protein SV760_00285, partial [Halobacteria archaeon]|nr:hypothetical protein [Halobacteria archaeon]
IDDTSVKVVWEKPSDSYSGVEEYTFNIGTRSNNYKTGKVKDSEVAVVNPGQPRVSPADRNRTIPVSLKLGENFVQVTAYDKAGNAREATLGICVGEQRPGVDCTTPGEMQRQRQQVEDAMAVQDLFGPDGLPDERFDKRLKEAFRCPGTYLCGQKRPGPWMGMVSNEKLLVHIQNSQGETVAKYYAELEDGEVKNMKRVEDVSEVSQSANVYLDAETTKTIMNADDKMGAIGNAYDNGEISIEGVGLGNTIKYGVFKMGKGIYDMATGII